ncbi:hypothetical protein FOBRF1_006875 [Fusarium oxysporum]
MAMTRENSPNSSSDNEEGGVPKPVTLMEPMGSLYEVTRLRSIRSNKATTTKSAQDTGDDIQYFISRGVISENEAADLFNVFLQTLNHYLWVGLEQTHPSLTAARKSSELLTATILTVTALHIPTSAETFDACYREFLQLISSSMFSRFHSIDDVRGLCIAAFWLSDVSWKLSGHAIRIATELNIHQPSCFLRALKGDRSSFQKVRLWYMLYICDRHFSIAYGRPPMITEGFQIRELELFLSSPLAGPLDVRILSQANLMQILTRLYNRFSEVRIRVDGDQYRARGISTFGSAEPSYSEGDFVSDLSSTNADDIAGTGSMLLESDLSVLGSYNLEIDQWRLRWYPRQPPSSFIGEFTNKGVVLYSYFAKLQVSSLAIRGVPATSQLSTERKELMNIALRNAENIITFVLEEDDIRKAMVGTPLYVHAMIALACVFLMKAMTKWNSFIGRALDFNYVFELLERMVTLLKSAVTSNRHILKHIAAGLEKMLNKIKAFQTRTWNRQQSGPRHQSTTTAPNTGNTSAMDWSLAARQSQYSAGFPGQDDAGQPILPSLPSTFEPPSTQAGSQQLPSTYWDSGHEQDPTATGVLGDYAMLLDDDVMFEVFGSDANNNVYNLLSSQFLPN